MSRSRTGHFKTGATLNGDAVREMGAELNGMEPVALEPSRPEPAKSELASQELTARSLSGPDAAANNLAGKNQAAGGVAQAGRSLSGAPLPGGNGRGLGRVAAGLGRSLGMAGGAAEEGSEDASGGRRALEVLKQGLPLVQKLLPLLEGNFLAVVSNLLAPRPQGQAKVDLAPLENQLTEIQLLQHDVRGKVAEHHMMLKRVEDQLEMVKEATDRNTMEQQELMEDLRAMGGKVNLFAAMLFGLLILSVILNFLLFMHIKQVLP